MCGLGTFREADPPFQINGGPSPCYAPLRATHSKGLNYIFALALLASSEGCVLCLYILLSYIYKNPRPRLRH